MRVVVANVVVREVGAVVTEERVEEEVVAEERLVAARPAFVEVEVAALLVVESVEETSVVELALVVVVAALDVVELALVVVVVVVVVVARPKSFIPPARSDPSS